MSVFKKLKKGGKEEKVAVVPDPDPPKALYARIPLDSYRDFFTLKNYWVSRLLLLTAVLL